MLIFNRERLQTIYEEILPLFQAHYEEIAWRKDKISLEIDQERYFSMNENGLLLCFTGRNSKGKLLAYSAFFLSFHPHYNSTKFAANDVIFVHPSVRDAGNGTALVNYCEAELKALGAQVITWHIKPNFDWSPLIKALNYEPGDSVWQKWIGGD